MSETRCPFCNAQFTPAPASSRFECPRCGEQLALDAAFCTPPSSAATVVATPVRVPEAATNRRLAWGVVGGMLAIAGLALVFALITVNTRREQDTYLPRSTRQPLLPPLTPTASGELVPPSRLAALGYLPPGCTLVAGVHVEQLLQSPVAEPFKHQHLSLGRIDLSLQSLETTLGIPAGNIDHLVIGSVLEEAGTISLTPPTVLVLRTRQPLGVNRFREALQATAPREVATPDGQARAISRGKFRDLPLTLWLPDPNTAVIGLFTDLASLPHRPGKD
ncbi:MAG: zinc ribbon domain-containing protein, partial [Gemmataceae bacterium]